MAEPKNLALPSIAAAWALNLVPHAYYFVKLMSASNYTATNITPRTNLDTLKTRLPTETWRALARARGAHLNALEGFPLFAACMAGLPTPHSTFSIFASRLFRNTHLLTHEQLAGSVAKLPSREMNKLAAEYIGVRVLYTALYMSVRSSEAASYLRTGVWAWSVAIPIYGLVRAGNAYNQGSGGL